MNPLDKIMNENIDDKKKLNVWCFKSEIEKMVHKIANGDFSGIETSVEMGETSVDDIQRVLKEYGCSIAPLPDIQHRERKQAERLSSTMDKRRGKK